MSATKKIIGPTPADQMSYAERIANGRCARCRGKSERGPYCPACLAYRAGQAKERRARRAKAGLCPMCGAAKPASGLAWCRACLDDSSASSSTAHKRLYAERRAAGQCVICAADSGEKWCCPKCRKKLAASYSARGSA